MADDIGGALTDLSGLDPDETRAFLAGMGERPYRGSQVFEWINRRFAAGFDEMTDLPAALRARLQKVARITRPAPLKELGSGAYDGATKYLLELEDCNIIECVRMSYDYGASACVSTQAGCRMGCVFCASGAGGLVRNLTAGEMCAQVYHIQRGLKPGRRVSNVVLMGCGEPLDNYENVMRFIRIIGSPEGINIGQRGITLSTCGLTDKIYRLADERPGGRPLRITLALSLHAPNDAVRRRLMPAARAHGMAETLRACGYYAEKTGRRVSYEYALIRGINDSDENARELASRLKGSLCHVNLIGLNAVAEGEAAGLRPSGRVNEFRSALAARGIAVSVRRRLGPEIDAACGQLRNRYRAGEGI